MRTNSVRHNRLVSARLHPLIYAAVAGIAVWFALAVWGFSGNGYTDYLLVVVSGFITVAVGLPFILSRVTRKDEPTAAHRNESDRGNSLRDWVDGELTTWQDRLKGSNAAIEILLPLAAAAFGMTMFGIVFHFVSGSVT